MTIEDLTKPLSEEELAKVKPLTTEEIEEAWEQGRREAEAFLKYANCGHVDPGLMFRVG